MDKQTEIKTLQSLKGDTYFNEFFNNHDIDQMCDNIKNDFPIDMACQFTAKVEALERQIKDMEAAHEAEMKELNDAHDAEMKEFGKKLIVDNHGDVDDIYDTLEDQFGREFIINTKHKNYIDLEDEEIEYLIGLMNGKKGQE